MKPAPILIDADLARRLTLEARRRSTEIAPLIRGVLADLLARLEAEEVAHAPSRFCRCGGAGCAPARFADGAAPGTEKLHGDRCMCAGAGCRERAAR